MIQCINCEDTRKRIKLLEEGIFWAVETAANQKKEYTAQLEALEEQAALVPDLLEVLWLINTDSDGDGFICREAMDFVRGVIDKAVSMGQNAEAQADE